MLLTLLIRYNAVFNWRFQSHIYDHILSPSASDTGTNRVGYNQISCFLRRMKNIKIDTSFFAAVIQWISSVSPLVDFLAGGPNVPIL